MWDIDMVNQNVNQNKMSKEKQSAFSMGMLTVLIGSMGIKLFEKGGWITYFGLGLIIIDLVIVYLYTKSE